MSSAMPRWRCCTRHILHGCSQTAPLPARNTQSIILNLSRRQPRNNKQVFQSMPLVFGFTKCQTGAGGAQKTLCNNQSLTKFPKHGSASDILAVLPLHSPTDATVSSSQRLHSHCAQIRLLSRADCFFKIWLQRELVTDLAWPVCEEEQHDVTRSDLRTEVNRDTEAADVSVHNLIF